MPNLVALAQTIWASVGSPKNVGAQGPTSLGWGMSDPTETCPSSSCVILPNLIALGQTVGAPLRRSSCKSLTLDVRPFIVTQGHWNWHGSTGYPLTSY